MTENKCLFCSIANHEIQSNIIYEDEKICCFLDLDPINEGHILIIPKKHYLDVDELDEETAMAIMKTSMLLVRIMKSIYKPNGYSIMQNGGEFNDIGHYHMHIFPRYKDDGFGWTYAEDSENGKFEIIKTKFVNELNKLMK